MAFAQNKTNSSSELLYILSLCQSITVSDISKHCCWSTLELIVEKKSVANS